MIRIALLMSLLSLLGCGQNRPEKPVDPGNDTTLAADVNRLVDLHFSATHGYHAYSNIGYKAERLESGKTRITIEFGNDRDRVIEAEGAVMDSLEAIVHEYKMYRYKGHYKPKFDILDGDSWDFYIRFADGKSASCNGYMAYPPHKGAEALGKVESFLSRWFYIEPAEEIALTLFRYEFHDAEGDEVFFFHEEDDFNAVYFRKYGSREGWNYYCGDPSLLERLSRDIRYMHLGSYPGEGLKEEDVTRPRWIMIAEYADGTRYEKMDYLDREPEDRWRHNVPSFTETGFRSTVEHYFSEEIQRIEALEPDQKGRHSCTTYDATGKALRTINYDGFGDVLNGHDYNDPHLKF